METPEKTTTVPRRSRFGRLSFYVGGAALATAVWGLQTYFVWQLPYVYPPPNDSLTQLQQSELQAFLDLNRLLTTLGTTMLGALGFLLATQHVDRSRPREMWPAFASGAFAGLSVYYGYAAHLAVIYMLQYPFFDLNYPPIHWPSRAHFYTLLLSAFFFGDFAIHALNKEDRRAKSQNVSPHS
jgi:hypothetical protein